MIPTFVGMVMGRGLLSFAGFFEAGHGNAAGGDVPGRDST
jgi:hypothetical protein